jgi:hypothetical protein
VTVDGIVIALLAAIVVPVWLILWHQFYECRPMGQRPHRRHVWDEDRKGDLFCARCDYVPRMLNEAREAVREAQRIQD